MFKNDIVPIFVAAALLFFKYSFSEDVPEETQTCPTSLLQSSHELSLPAHFILSMRVHRNIRQGPVCRDRAVLLYLCSLLLANSYAPEPNPGPRTVKFPCGVCTKACKWTTPSVCCDTCDTWYHQHCMGMPDAVFHALTNVSWECIQCGVPNFSTGIFDTTIFESTNSFSSLGDITTEGEISFNCPNATSSPHRRFQSTASDTTPTRRQDMPLRVLVINCQSIKSPGKRAQLENMIASTSADIVIGTESWLDRSINSSEVFPQGFKAYRKDRPSDRNGGGVFILVSSKFSSDQPEELRTDGDSEMVWCNIRIKGVQSLYVCAFYKPPSTTNPDYLQDLATSLSRIPRGSHLWLGGDFNLADINWADECVSPQAANTRQSTQLIDITKDAFLDQVVTEPTRITEYTSSLLDLFFTNNKSLINKCEVIPGIGDHEAIFIESSLRPMRMNNPPRKVLIYKKADYDAIRDGLSSYYNSFSEAMENCPVNEAWKLFEGKLKQLMTAFIPSKVLSGNKTNKPWISKEVKTNIRKRNRLYHKQKATNKPKDRKRFLRVRTETQRLERKSYWKYLEDLIEVGDPESGQCQSKQKRFWRYIKSLKKDNCGISPLKDQGKLHSDPVDKANILNRQYQSVFTREDTSNLPTPEGEPSPTMPSISVTNAGVLKLLQKLNPNKATGPDMIPARILKELADVLAPYLCDIFQACLSTGCIPDVWRTANISAIFKKGDRFKPSNYRPVSLTCICSKLLEHVVVSNIMQHLDKHDILTDCQHGFRQKRSCETQLLTLVDELSKSMDRRKQHDLAVLDFSKAFDRVPHSRLLTKLEHYGIRGNTLNWIRAFLLGRTQRVIVEGATSDPAAVSSGVPQGSVLGPALFLIFINDLPLQVHSRTRLFADDCVVYREINSLQDCHMLQADLRALEGWEKKWGMCFHPEKCSILRVHRKRSPIHFDYTLKGHDLVADTTTRYLGVDLTQNLSWNTHINKTVKSGNSTLGFLRRNLRIGNEEVKSAAYFSLVRPKLEYCSSVWNPYTKVLANKLEMVQRRAARFATNRYHNTSSVTAMLDHLNWETLESRRAKAQLVMLYKIVNGLVAVPCQQYLTPSTRSQNTGRRFIQQSASTSQYLKSFFPRTTVAWNKLPASVVESPDLVSFKQGLSTLSF